MPYDQIYWNGGGGFEDPGEYITSAQQRMVVGKTANSHPDSLFTPHPAVEDLNNLQTEPTAQDPNQASISDYLAVTGSRQGYSNTPAYADFIANNSNDTFFMGVHDSNRISVTHAGIPYNGCRLILRTEFGYAAGRPTFTTNLVGGGTAEDNLVESFDFKSFSVYKNNVLQRPRESNHAGRRFVNITSANSTLPATATVAKAGTTLTFANVDIRTYLLPNFVVVQGANRLNITSIDSITTATTDSTVANFTAATFSIDIACGSPDVDDCAVSTSNQLAIRGRDYRAAGVQGQGNNATWGLFCVKDALVNGNVVNNVFRDTTKNGVSEGNYWPLEHPLFSRFLDVFPGSQDTTFNGWWDFDGDSVHDTPGRLDQYSMFSSEYQQQGTTQVFLYDVRGFGANLRKSSAAWPCYGNDIGALSARANAGRLPVPVLNRDSPKLTRCSVGLKEDTGAGFQEDNDEILARNAYPFCLAQYGFDDPFPRPNTADHYLTLWETDEVIAPGDVFSVALSTLSYEKSPNFKFADMRYQLILMAKN